MAKDSPYFWTDEQQASQRLRNSVVMYDGEPVFIRDVRGGYEDGIPRALLTYCKDGKDSTRRLDSPKFGRFRTLPKLGWLNNENGRPFFLERQTRRTVTHGLSNNNVVVYRKVGDSYDWNTRDEYGDGSSFNRICFEQGFVNLQKNVFPSLQGTLTNIGEDQAVAYSPLYLVYRDTLGLRWLYRGIERIGLFTGTDTLNLLSKFSFYREEIMADPAFTLNNIQEF